jgi:hypothetical protein
MPWNRFGLLKNVQNLGSVFWAKRSNQRPDAAMARRWAVETSFHVGNNTVMPFGCLPSYKVTKDNCRWITREDQLLSDLDTVHCSK